MDVLWKVQGSMKLGRLAKSVAAEVNVKRRARGLLPRPVSSTIRQIQIITFRFEIRFLYLSFFLFEGAGWNNWLSKCWKVIFNKSFTETSYVSSSSKTRCNKSIKVGFTFLFYFFSKSGIFGVFWLFICSWCW